MIINFTYLAPTKIVFGENTEEQVGALVKEQNCKKVLLHYGGGSAKKSGLLDRVTQSLKDAGVDFVELGGVAANPRLSLVYEGIELCKKEDVDFILAVGGGSVIDSAKAIGTGVVNGGDVWDFFDKKRASQGCLPIGCVLTIAAAGSEMSWASVITKDEGLLKRGFGSDHNRLRFSILNPRLTMTLPEYQTQSGCVDVFMHTMERYFNNQDNMELTDGFAETLMTTVMKNAKILMDEPDNYNARAEVMWAGALSHNGITGCGTGGGDWATHNMEMELSGMFDVAHGAGLAALLGNWMRYVYKHNPQRFEKFALNVVGVEPAASQEETIMRGIEGMEAFFRSVNMPTSIRELGVEVTDAQIQELAEKCSQAMGGTNGVIVPLTTAQMAEIYTAAR